MQAFHLTAWNTSAIFRSFSFSRSNRMRKLFVKCLIFSFNLMVVSTRSWSQPMSAPGRDLVFVEAELRALGCQSKIYLVVNLSIRGMLGCCPIQLVEVESVGKDTSVALWKLKESQSSVVCLFNAKSSYCPCPVLVCVRAYFGMPVALNYKYILHGSLCYDVIKLLVEVFDLLVFVVWS